MCLSGGNVFICFWFSKLWHAFAASNGAQKKDPVSEAYDSSQSKIWYEPIFSHLDPVHARFFNLHKIENPQNQKIWTSNFQKIGPYLSERHFSESCAPRKNVQNRIDEMLWGQTCKHSFYFNLRISELWVLGPGFLTWDLGTRILVPGSWYQDLGTKILVPRPLYKDLSTKILVPRSWYQDPGTKILVPRSWY